MHKVILFLSAVVFIAGCGFPKSIDTSALVYSDVTYNKKSFNNKNKSLVVLSCESTGDLSNMNVTLGVKGVDNSMPETFFSTNNSYPIDIMLSPGVYEISKIQLYTTWSEYHGNYTVVKKRTLDINNVASLSKIEVHPDEVVYIGNFLVTATKQKDNSSLYATSVSVGEMPERLTPFIEEYEKITNKKTAFRIVEAAKGESK